MEITTIILIALGIITLCTLIILRSVNPIYSILNLILIYGCYSIILLTVEMEFLACIYILVNVGAIAVLFLFIVMMININVVEIQETMKKYNIYIFMGFFAIIGIIGIILTNNELRLKDEIIKDITLYLPTLQSVDVCLKTTVQYTNMYELFIETTDIRNMGSNIIYGTHSIWFMMACLILLIGMVGVIYITEDLIIEKRILNERRRQDINSQILRDYKETIKNYKINLK